MTAQPPARESQHHLRHLNVLREWLSQRVRLMPPEGPAKPRSRAILASCLLVFFIAVGVRLLHYWQDSHVWIVSGKTSLNGISSSDDRKPRWLNLPVAVALHNNIISQSLVVDEQAQSVWSRLPGELQEQGALLSAKAAMAMAFGGQGLELTGDGSAYDDQFASAMIDVEKNTDYVLVWPATLSRGDMAIKVTDADRRITLALVSLSAAQKEAAEARGEDQQAAQASDFTTAIQLPFVTGNRTQIRLVLSNNAAASAAPVAALGQAALYKMGATPATWTRLPRGVVRGIQRNLFTTNHLLPLVIIGLALLLLAGQWRVALIMLAVPLYYLSVHSLLHTEYRYILGIHYFLFILAGVTLSGLLTVSRAGAGRLWEVARDRAVGSARRRA
jgi:hypothetical protein